MTKGVAGLIALTAILIGVMMAPTVRADESDKKTIFTFSEPIQVPGTVLPAGTYVFKLLGDAGDRNIVQIFNADETKLITTVMTIPDSRDTPAGKTIVTFDERPTGEPEAIQNWFYPGDNSGQEFVYPKRKATQLAQVNSKPVPSVPDEATQPTALKTAVVTRTSAVPTAAASPTHETVSVTEVEEVEELPQTASPLALIALLGAMSLAGAAVLRRLATATK
jgi:hypothetical protein